MMGRQHTAATGQVDDLVSVGSFEGPAIQYLAGPAECDLGPIQAEDPFPAAGLSQIVGCDQERPSVGRQLGAQIFEPGRRRSIQSGEGLIEEQDGCLLYQGASDQGALALTPGKLAEAT